MKYFENLNAYLGETEPWKIKDDGLKKGKIIAYSMHCLLAVIPEFSALNPKFYQDLVGYFSAAGLKLNFANDGRAGWIESSFDEN